MSNWQEEKIEELCCKYADDYGNFHKDNTVSLKTEIIERELLELINQVRLETLKEVENMMPKMREVYHNKGAEEFESNYAYNSAIMEIKNSLNKLK